jgi:hypothetical protein
LRGLEAFLRTAVVLAAALGASGGLSPNQASPTARATGAGRAPASVSASTATQSRVEIAPMNAIGSWPAPGERWIFRFDRKASASRSGRLWLSISLGGRATVERLGSLGGNALYLLGFEIDRIEMQGQARTASRALPFVRIEVTPEGRVRELRWAHSPSRAAGSDAEAEDAARDLASQWLFFEAESRLGRAETELDRLADGPAVRAWTKRVTGYPGHEEISGLDSFHEWRASAGRGEPLRVERIEGSESFAIASAGGSFEQSTSYRWARIETLAGTRSPEISAGDAFRVADIGSGTPTQTRAPARVERAELRAAWTKLADVSSRDRLRLFERVRRALAGGQSELVADVLAGLKGKPASSIEWRTGVGLLASTSNPEAQAALLSLYSEPGRASAEKLTILAGVAAGEGKPAPEWKETLARETELGSARADDESRAIREASLYALGSAIRKETDPSARGELESLLSARIAEARTPAERIATLEAVGNSASPEFHSYVLAQLASPDARVRAKAVVASRDFPPELSRPVLETAKNDPSPLVRRAAERNTRSLENEALRSE